MSVSSIERENISVSDEEWAELLSTFVDRGSVGAQIMEEIRSVNNQGLATGGKMFAGKPLTASVIGGVNSALTRFGRSHRIKDLPKGGSWNRRKLFLVKVAT